MIDITLQTLVIYCAAFIGTGLIGGFLAGLFGIGGGAVMVPVFYQLMILAGTDQSVAMHLSVGTSLAVIVPTSIRSFQSHHAKNAVDMALLKNWIIAVPLGALLGTFIAAIVSGAELRLIFAFIALFVALRLLLNRESWRLGPDIPSEPARSIAGTIIGILSTLMGIGGGVLNNTFMTLFGRPVHQAIATSSGVGVLISIPAVIGYTIGGWGNELLPPFSLGYVSIVAVLFVMPISVLAAPYGARLTHRLDKRQLEIAFGVFLLLVSARFFVSAL